MPDESMTLIGIKELDDAWDVLFKQSEAIFKEHSTIDLTTAEGTARAMTHPQEVQAEANRLNEQLKQPFINLGYDPDQLDTFAGGYAWSVMRSIREGVVVSAHEGIRLAIVRAVTIGAQASLQRIEDAN